MIREKLGPYEIIESIGSGGMGEVWKARDTRLGRIVAIKKVKEQHSERFKQEARSIAALNHPNICQIFDIGDDYLVLEYVEGKPLSSPLPEKEAVRLAIQIATALEEAHQHGIIHRDLKPSNIMVTDKGAVKLLDFGLAKLYEQDQSISSLPTEDFPATQAGAILGTVAYMSPEQAQGKPADGRSDIFSFGLVLYEMLSGRRAFSGDSNYAVMDAIVRSQPPPLQASPALEKIVKRCLEKSPSNRYQTMSEVKEILEKTVEPKVAASSTKPQSSIAVLPFVNMSGDKEQEYFSDGLAEEIINALTQIPGLKVTARTSAFAFKEKQEDIRRIAELLGVVNVLEGSVRKAGNRIRVTAQLISAADGNHLWSERYDRELNDVFAIQDEISGSIAEKLRVQVSGRPIAKSQTKNIEAYNLHLKARYHFEKLTPEGLSKSKEYCEQAIKLDPDYAVAWCDLADYYAMVGNLGIMPPKPATIEARIAVWKALELDESLPEAHAVSAVLCVGEFDWKGAERELRRALELNPTSAGVLTIYSLYYLLPLQRFDEAIAISRKALDLDPLSPLMHGNLGLIYTHCHQWDRALEEFNSALEIDPHSGASYFRLAFMHFSAENYDEAISAAGAAIREMGQVPTLPFLGAIYARTGRIAEARKILDELQDIAQKMHIPPVYIAVLYSALAMTDQALDCYERAVEEASLVTILSVALDPFDEPLRSHPRFIALRRKMNLEP